MGNILKSDLIRVLEQVSSNDTQTTISCLLDVLRSIALFENDSMICPSLKIRILESISIYLDTVDAFLATKTHVHSKSQLWDTFIILCLDLTFLKDATVYFEPVLAKCIVHYSEYQSFSPVFLMRIFEHVFSIDFAKNERFYSMLHVLKSCITIEFNQTSNFKIVELACIEKLHQILLNNPLFIVPKIFLNDMTLFFEFFEDQLKSQGFYLIKAIKKFVPLMHNLLASRLCSQTELITAIIRVCRFLRHIKQRKLYLDYLYELFDIHKEANNYVEAAITIWQHSQLIGWTFKVVPEILRFSDIPKNASEFQLNERIHKECINLLDLGEAWERAISLMKVLETKYEEKLYYEKLSEIATLKGKIFEKILKHHRSFSSFYRVCFHGDGFSNHLDGKQFIYRGQNWEHIASFCERLSHEYHPVNIISSISPKIREELKKPGARFIHVAAVNPISDIRQWQAKNIFLWSIESYFNETCLKQREKVSTPLWLFTPELYWNNPEYEEAMRKKKEFNEKTSSFRESNEVSIFFLSKPIRRPENRISDSPAKDFLELWTEATVLFTECSLPFMARQSRIEQLLSFQISPIENAIIAIRAKTHELRQLEFDYMQKSKNPTFNSIERSVESDLINSNPFTMALNGAVAAPVNGGIPLYKQAFLDNPEYISEENLTLRKVLNQAILDQVLIRLF